MTTPGWPEAQGLYDPRHEHEACGVGFVVDMKGCMWRLMSWSPTE